MHQALNAHHLYHMYIQKGWKKKSPFMQHQKLQPRESQEKVKQMVFGGLLSNHFRALWCQKCSLFHRCLIDAFKLTYAHKLTEIVLESLTFPVKK